MDKYILKGLHAWCNWVFNMVFQYIMMGVLFLTAIFLVVAVLLQKTKEDGLSGAISGRQDTFYNKDKAGRTDSLLKKLTLVAGCIFAISVLLIFIVQPDYSWTQVSGSWKDLTSFASLLN